MRLVALVLALLFVTVALLPIPARGQTTLTSICDIVRDPTQFDGKEVTVRGIWASDYFEYSLINDPACQHGLAPWFGAANTPGERAFDAVLCDRQGGLVQVTARGRIEARPGEVPNLRFYILEFSDPAHVALDPSWQDPRNFFAHEAQRSWQNVRQRFCMTRGFVDHETLELVEPPPS